MALSDGPASAIQVERAQELARERRARFERSAAEDRARTSDVRDTVDESGTAWRYVVVDGEWIRIVSCEARSEALVIPEAIEGKPVMALAPDACARQDGVRSIVCPDTLASIGPCAFRENEDLERIVFPRGIEEFDSHWVRSCRKLTSLTLPGSLLKIDSSIFDMSSLKELVIGAGTAAVEPGAFAKSEIETVEVAEENLHLTTDGTALYSKDGRSLIALVRPVSSYAVAEGCETIAKKAFSGFGALEDVRLPESLRSIGEFAFSRTSIEELMAPVRLREIKEKAFFNCEKLVRVTLNEGLASIKDNGFSNTGLTELEVPSTIERLGNPVAAHTGVTFCGAEATFSIREGGIHLHLDEQGGLYRETEDGLCFARLMADEIERYEVQPGTAFIEAAAFAGQGTLCEVVLPDSLRVVGEGAFKGCRGLRMIEGGKAIERIEAEAFLDTAIERSVLPKTLVHLGENALVTYGAHHRLGTPELQEVVVEADNERFFAEEGLLFERKPTGKLRLLLCTGGVSTVRLDERVDEVAPYAMNNVKGVEELLIGDWITNVGIRGLALSGLVSRVRIGLSEPRDGRTSYEVRFPQSERSEAQLAFALSIPERVEPAVFFEHYDTSIVIASGFDAATDERLDLYEQGCHLVERLRDPVFMTAVNRELAERVLRDNVEELCVEAVRHDDRSLIDGLLDLGFLNESNLFAVIDRLSSLRDASITGYLLEVKRARFAGDALDFDL